MQETADKTGETGVSVIVPLYNAAEFIGNCLEGIRSQTFGSGLEIIVVDDASTDRGPELVMELARKDQRIRLVRMAVNQGPSAARNRGLAAARGEYILFADADDSMDENTIELLVARADDTGCDLVVCDSKRILGGKNIHAEKYFFEADRTFSGEGIPALLMGQLRLDKTVGTFLGSVWGKLYRRSIIVANGLAFPEEMRTSEDIAFNCDYIGHVRDIRYIHRQLYDYHIHPNVRTALASSPSPLDVKEAVIRAMGSLRRLGVDEREVVASGRHGMVYFSVKVLVTLHILYLRGKLPDAVDGKALRGHIRRVGEDAFVREALAEYRPTPGESFWIPFFMKYGLWRLAGFACKRRAAQIIRG